MKAALVTGAGSGIGAAIARTLATRGVAIAVNHLGEGDRAGAEATAADCRAAGVSATLVQGDVGEDADCRRIVAEAAGWQGRLDYLVNNAAYSHGRPLTDLDGVEVAEIEQSFRVNTIGPFLLSRYAAPHMRSSGGGGGAIVNIASMAGLIGMGSSYGYVTSKAALINLTRALARALAPDIRVNSVAPGLVDTPWPRAALGDRFEAIADAAASASPLGRLLTPEEVAVPVAFLLLDAAQVTGECLRIDGGGHLGK